MQRQTFQLAIRTAVALVLLGGAREGAAAASTDVVNLAVAVPSGQESVEKVEAELVWLGEKTRLDLQAVDDGTLHIATLDGAPVDALPVRLWLQREGEEEAVPVYAGVEQLQDGGGALSWTLDPETGRTRRMVELRRGGEAELVGEEATRIFLGLAWIALAMLGLTLLQRREPTTRPPAASTGGWLQRAAAWPFLWLGLAAAWTWPAGVAGPRFWVGQPAGSQESLWVLGAARRILGHGLHDSLSALPQGADLADLGTRLLLLPGALLPMAQQATAAARLHGMLALLGVALSGWTAQQLAEQVGARRPWSVVAGLLFACSGLGAQALVLGEPATLVDPWLPLLALGLWRTGPGAHPGWSVLAGLALVLAAATSPALGVAALVLVGGLLAFRWRERGQPPAWLPLLPGALLAALGLGLLAWVGDLPDAAPGQVAAGTSLVQLAGPTLETDRLGRALAFAPSGLGLGLLLLAPAVLGERRGWRPWLWTAGLALLLGLGASLSIDGQGGLPLPLAPLLVLGLDRLLPEPMVLAWVTLLAGGVVAAWVASELAEQRGGLARLLPAALLVEAMLLVGMPGRLQAHRVDLPSAPSTAQGGLLDLVPDATWLPGRERALSRSLCRAQQAHGRAIAEDCTTTDALSNPRAVLDAQVGARLLEGRTQEVAASLAAQGFTSLALRPDLFHPGDRARLRHALAALSDEVETSTDGGVLVELYPLGTEASTEGVPDSGPASRIGAASLAEEEASTELAVQGLRVEVQVPEGLVLQDQLAMDGSAPPRFALELTSPTGGVRELQLRDDGSALQDEPEDGIYVASLARSLDPVQQARLFDLGEPEPVLLWSGEVVLADAWDRLAFRLQEGGVAVPVLTLPGVSPVPAAAASGRAASLGWGLVLLAGLGCGLLHRRS